MRRTKSYAIPHCCWLRQQQRNCYRFQQNPCICTEKTPLWASKNSTFPIQNAAKKRPAWSAHWQFSQFDGTRQFFSTRKQACLNVSHPRYGAFTLAPNLRGQDSLRYTADTNSQKRTKCNGQSQWWKKKAGVSSGVTNVNYVAISLCRKKKNDAGKGSPH